MVNDKRNIRNISHSSKSRRVFFHR